MNTRAFWLTTLLLSVALSSIAPGGTLLAATPHATSRACGFPGGATCPSPPPMITPWIYSANNPQLSGNPQFHSLGDLEAAWTAYFYKFLLYHL